MPQVLRAAEAHHLPVAKAGLVFAGLAALAVIDVAHDLSNGASPSLAAAELVAMTAVIAAAVFCWVHSVRARRDARGLVKRLDVARADAERWRREAANVLPALGTAMRRQLDRWGLSDDERRTALLLLSGRSLHEIARRIGTTPGAARRLVTSVYAKADVGGRAELSAFFLQDLFYLVSVPSEVEDRELAAEP